MSQTNPQSDKQNNPNQQTPSKANQISTNQDSIQQAKDSLMLKMENELSEPEAAETGMEYVEPQAPGKEYIAEWINISVLSTQNEQIERIKEEIKSFFDKLNNKQYPVLNQDNIRWIRREWQRNKNQAEQDYLENLFSKESEFRENFQEFVAAQQELERLQNEQKELEMRGDNDEMRLKIVENQIKNWSEWQKKNEENFKSRLASLPWNIVLIGRVEVKAGLAIDKYSEKLNSPMQRTAMVKVSKSTHESYNSSDETGKIIKYINQEQSGDVQVSDSRGVIAKDPCSAGNYYYLMQRLEVYPFSKTKPSSNMDDYNLKKNIDNVKMRIFILNDDLTMVDCQNDSSYTLEEMWIANSTNFLKPIIDIKKSQNKQISEKIKNFKTKFLEKNEYYEGKIIYYKSEAENLEQSIALNKNKLYDAKTKIADLEKKLTSLEAEYIASKEVYEEAYKNKTALISEEKTYSLTTANYLDEAESIYRKVLEDHRKSHSEKTIRITRMTGSSPDRFGEYSIESRTVPYYAKISQFKILYIDNQANSELGFGLLNLAFTLSFTTLKEAEIDTVSKSFKQLVQGNSWLEWKTTPGYHTSITLGDPPEGNSSWRLPKIAELASLYAAIKRYDEREKADVFSVLNWKKKIYLSSDSKYDNYGNKLIKVYDFSSPEGEIKEKSYSEAAYLIWLREYQETED